MPDCVGKNYFTPRRFARCLKINAIIIVNIVAMVVTLTGTESYVEREKTFRSRIQMKPKD